jgi:hypothetical protein
MAHSSAPVRILYPAQVTFGIETASLNEVRDIFCAIDARKNITRHPFALQRNSNGLFA